jgi:hypothetical protein
MATNASDNWITIAKHKKEDKCEPKVNIKISRTQRTTPNLPRKSPSPHYLNDTWVLWLHDHNSVEWSLENYQQLLEFNTVEDFWIAYNNVKNLDIDMFFLMRKGYLPIWDHEINISGAGWTFKIEKKHAFDFWERISCFCVGETISTTPSNVVGVSISPKFHFATVRVWTKTNNKNVREFDRVKEVTKNDAYPIDFANTRFTPNTEAAK